MAANEQKMSWLQLAEHTPDINAMKKNLSGIRPLFQQADGRSSSTAAAAGLARPAP